MLIRLPRPKSMITWRFYFWYFRDRYCSLYSPQLCWGLNGRSVKGYFDTDILAGLCGEAGHYRKTVDKEHGGTAVREYYITEDIQWFSEIKKWKKLKSIGMVHKVLKKTNGSQAEEYRYYICSIGADAEEFERAAHGHWGVENSLHWQLNFTFGDDKTRAWQKHVQRTCRS